MYLGVPSLLESVMVLPYVSQCISVVVFMCVCMCVCVCVQVMCSRIVQCHLHNVYTLGCVNQYEGMFTHSIWAEHGVGKKRLEVSNS